MEGLAEQPLKHASFLALVDRHLIRKVAELPLLQASDIDCARCFASFFGNDANCSRYALKSPSGATSATRMAGWVCISAMKCCAKKARSTLGSEAKYRETACTN